VILQDETLLHLLEQSEIHKVEQMFKQLLIGSDQFISHAWMINLQSLGLLQKCEKQILVHHQKVNI
jgi:hypothetical protein